MNWDKATTERLKNLRLLGLLLILLAFAGASFPYFAKEIASNQSESYYYLSALFAFMGIYCILNGK